MGTLSHCVWLHTKDNILDERCWLYTCPRIILLIIQVIGNRSSDNVDDRWFETKASWSIPSAKVFIFHGGHRILPGNSLEMKCQIYFDQSSSTPAPVMMCKQSPAECCPPHRIRKRGQTDKNVRRTASGLSLAGRSIGKKWISGYAREDKMS